jgi:rubrerythrin
MPKKEEKSNMDYTKYLIPIGSKLYSCECCGQPLEPTDLVFVCPDCSAVICESCVRAGRVDSHDCED